MPAQDLSDLVWVCMDAGPYPCRPNSRCGDGCRWTRPDPCTPVPKKENENG